MRAYDSVMTRRLLTRALAVLGVVLVGLVVVGLGVAAPASAVTDAGHPSSPTATTADGFLRFRLPYLDGIAPAPDFPNLARAASGHAPLLLFLPATGAKPDDYRAFLGTAAAAGYSVLGLDYPNLGRSVTRTCLADAKCYTMLQRNRFTGAHPSRFSHVSTANSIANRFRASVRYLQQHDPHGRWGRYLEHGRIEWSRIVLAGHSQGGGESAFIAHYYRVQGVLMFASPVESDNGVVADWMARAGVTPTSRYIGFDAAHDMYFDRIQGSWNALGLGAHGRQAVVADAPPPTGTHRIVTDVDLGAPDAAHSLLITDAGPRGQSGVPVFRNVWLWMLHAVRPAALGAPAVGSSTLDAGSAGP